MRLAIIVRPKIEGRGSKVPPWALLRLMVEAFGWTVESLDEATTPAPPPIEQPQSPEEIAARERSALVAFIGEVRKERDSMREAMGSFEVIETYLVRMLEATAPGTGLPVATEENEKEQVN